MSQSPILWEPDPVAIETANVTEFTALASERFGRTFDSYRDLHAWSIAEPEEFWGLLWDFLGIKYSQSWITAMEEREPMRTTRFYAGSKLNFAENLMRFRDERVVLIFRDEVGNRIEWSAAQLWSEVAGLAAGMRAAGIVAGDRVAAFVPNHPTTVAAMLAATSIGAVWSSCSPDFGTSGVVDRFGQIEPKLLIACNRYHYNGKTFELLPRIADIVERLPSVETTVVFPYLDETPDVSGIANASPLGDFRADATEIDFQQLPFDHPLFILFTSGTTGVPKCIVHRAGGALVQLMKDHQLHCDLGADDRLFFYSTCGWMMWNWLVTALASEAAVVLYDGSPFHSGPQALWQLAEEERVTAFGVGAKYLSSLQKSGYEPNRHHKLSTVQLLMSTGSVLPPEGFDFVYDKISHHALLASVTGGTDILSAFALGVPTLPLYRGELQCLALGMATNVFDQQGEPIVGESGELVCTKPFPSMPIGFWNDEDDRRYSAAYFERFPGVWHHGDFAELTSNGGLIMHGRSDAVLNPGGVRIGTAEIYRQVEKLDEVVESICVGQEWENDVRVVLFVVLRGELRLDEALATRIRSAIRQHASPRHVPAKIVAMPDVPKTRTGKLAEIAVRDAIHGRSVANTDALANPESLDHYADLSELRS